MPLHKILESDKERIIRFCFAEDPNLIAIYQIPNAANGLDSCVEVVVSTISENSKFYKVETETGAILGYFAQRPPVNNKWFIDSYVIRKPFRTSNYINQFWDMVRSTFENGLESSVSDVNYTQNKDQLKSNYTIQIPTKYYGKNYLLLSAINSI